MEPMAADDLDESRLEAEALLGQHASGYAAHIIEDDDRVATIRRDIAPTHRRPAKARSRHSGAAGHGCRYTLDASSVRSRGPHLRQTRFASHPDDFPQQLNPFGQPG